MNLSIYSREGWVGDFYDTKLTKLGSNKEKANVAHIWGIKLQYCEAIILFSML